MKFTTVLAKISSVHSLSKTYPKRPRTTDAYQCHRGKMQQIIMQIQPKQDVSLLLACYQLAMVGMRNKNRLTVVNRGMISIMVYVSVFFVVCCGLIYV